jgi:hypothetical protein
LKIILRFEQRALFLIGRRAEYPMERNDIKTRTTIAQRFSGPVVRLGPALFHFANALGLPTLFLGRSDDLRNWDSQRRAN